MVKHLFVVMLVLLSLASVLSAPIEDDVEIFHSSVDNESRVPKKATKRGIHYPYGLYGHYYIPRKTYLFTPLYKTYGYYGHRYGLGHNFHHYPLGYHNYGHGHYW
ncbi:uncharacterized protein LOC143205326 [Rhynchophorus ferrugineus]|uniref:Uncharacterized protein n=1 Tax=Rhynchophorus ferrugineus TaxID=354439 RepID=A0A834HNI2_RHYFE|nr:hypothetical protein GWI33_020986 [Rhynchophorus ferrugineus]